MVAMMAKYKEHVEVIPIDYKYSLAIKTKLKHTETLFKNICLLDIDWRLQNE